MLLVNQTLHNRYRILRQLGHGGMGAVYEAHDNVFDTTCAIKEIIIDLSKSSNPKQQELVMLAFEREAKLLAKIKHEAVPHVRDYFTESDRQYLVMELVEGTELGDMLEERRSPFPVEDVVRWMEQLLDGLDYLHTQNPPIFHRDIKPQNLKLTPRGKMKLLDFGIAKGGAETPNQQTINNQTFVAATLNYSPVEQIFRVLDPVFREMLTQRYPERVAEVLQQNADARSDLYALGATAYHLLTNQLPLDALKRTVEVWSGKSDPLTHPTTLNPHVPPEIAAVLLRSMELDHGRRYASALEMQQALQRGLADLRGRAAAQGQPTLNIESSSGGLQATQLGALAANTGDTNAATVSIPADKLPQAPYHPNISEQTIQSAGAPAGYGQPTGEAPPPTPFNTGGQPTAMSAFPSTPTGGQMPPPPNYQNYQPHGVVSSGAPFAPAAAPPQKKSRLWLIAIPVVLLLFFVVAAAAGGAYFYYQSVGGGGVTPTPEVSPSAAPSKSATPAASATPSASPSASPSATPTPDKWTSPTPTPAADPTKPAVQTPAPQPKTPTKPTQKPATKKNSDCIFSGDC